MVNDDGDESCGIIFIILCIFFFRNKNYVDQIFLSEITTQRKQKIPSKKLGLKNKDFSVSIAIATHCFAIQFNATQLQLQPVL